MKSPQVPEADRRVGMLVYGTNNPGTGGFIKKNLEDFAVSEILHASAQSRISSNPGYAVYLLKKTGIDTNHAVRQILHRTGVRLKPLGLKDARAVTEQYVCAASKSRTLEEWSSNNVSIKRVGYTQRPLSKGDMAGNRFTIKVTGMDADLSDFGFDVTPNFFGYQRFGSKRAVSHLIGKALIYGDWGEAVRLLLSFTSEYDTAERNQIRQKLADASNYSGMIDELSPGMDLERTVLTEMVRGSTPRRAIGAIPVAMRRFFVQAYQSYLFNLTLSHLSYGEGWHSAHKDDVCFDEKGEISRYKERKDQRLAIPLVGYAYYKKTRFHEIISGVMESEGVSPKDFFIRDMQEASSEGGFRHAALECADVKLSGDTVGFTLRRGSFATIVLREIIKPEDPFGCGF